MIIVLPSDDDIERLDSMMGRFDTNVFEERLQIGSDFSEVDVILPRCQFRQHFMNVFNVFGYNDDSLCYL
jgi:hypothetical protein